MLVITLRAEKKEMHPQKMIWHSRANRKEEFDKCIANHICVVLFFSS